MVQPAQLPLSPRPGPPLPPKSPSKQRTPRDAPECVRMCASASFRIAFVSVSLLFEEDVCVSSAATLMPSLPAKASDGASSRRSSSASAQVAAAFCCPCVWPYPRFQCLASANYAHRASVAWRALAFTCVPVSSASFTRRACCSHRVWTTGCSTCRPRLDRYACAFSTLRQLAASLVTRGH